MLNEKGRERRNPFAAVGKRGIMAETSPLIYLHLSLAVINE